MSLAILGSERASVNEKATNHFNLPCGATWRVWDELRREFHSWFWGAETL